MRTSSTGNSFPLTKKCPTEPASAWSLDRPSRSMYATARESFASTLGKSAASTRLRDESSSGTLSGLAFLRF